MKPGYTKHLFVFFIFLWNSCVFAGAPQLPSEETTDKDVIAPVLIRDENNKDQGQFGFFSAEPTPQRPDALTIIRDELHRMEAAEQMQAQKDGVFLSTTKRFTPESLTFFAAIGAVTFSSMWIKSHGDPLAMERHILSLKDPIAHLSFYTFMQTQGFYMNFHTARAGFATMDPATRAQMLRRLSYQGMAVGSLASSIAADLGHSVKMCVDKWMKGKTDEQSLMSCNEAWKQWTVRNKFTQYFPQIISMWASQATTELIEAGAARAFSKIVITNFVKGLLTREGITKLAYKVTGADAVLTLVPGGGWVMKSVKILGKITRFGMFVAVDHFLSKYTYRPINNIIQPTLFEYNAGKINAYWREADAGNWDQTKIKDHTILGNFDAEIESYGVRMQQWRDHLNQDAETDLAGWMEMTKKLLNQVDYAYKFYKGFSSTLFQTKSTDWEVANGRLEPSASEIIGRYPLRTLPFYGVSTGPYRAANGSIEDLYLLSPNELEKRQREHILNVASAIKKAKINLKTSEQTELNSIIDKLSSNGNDKRMASGLNDINQIIAIYEMQMREEHPYSSYSYEYIGLLKKVRAMLGNPQPVIYPLAGYSQAVAANSVGIVSARSADFSKYSVRKGYKFNKEADLMMYRLICGEQTGYLSSLSLVGVNFTSPEFTPPAMVKPGADKKKFCGGIVTTNNFYSTKTDEGKTLKDYMQENIDYRIIGDYHNPESQSGFEKWWLVRARQPIDAEFKKFDEKFREVVKTADNNFFDHRNFFKFFVDGLNSSAYLPKSLDASLKMELNVYLQIINRALITQPVSLPSKKNNTIQAEPEKLTLLQRLSQSIFDNRSGPMSMFMSSTVKENLTPYDYLVNARTNSEQLNFESIYKRGPTEIRILNDLFYDYTNMIRSNQINFDQYIAHSKKIDQIINDILVLAGLKKVAAAVTTNSEGVEDLLAPTPSATGTENTSKVYEDIQVANPTFRQKMIISSVRGIRQVEAEIRRFIRMKVMLSQSLELDTREFMNDWNNANPAMKNAARKANPFGG